MTRIGTHAVSGVTFSEDFSACRQQDKGANYIQGCVTPSAPATIVMKSISAQMAASPSARGVLLHEYSHTVQFALGYAKVVAATDPIFGTGAGFEQSADCMAKALGATTAKPGGYTSDCSGQRGQIAAALLAGQLTIG